MKRECVDDRAGASPDTATGAGSATVRFDMIAVAPRHCTLTVDPDRPFLSVDASPSNAFTWMVLLERGEHKTCVSLVETPCLRRLGGRRYWHADAVRPAQLDGALRRAGR